MRKLFFLLGLTLFAAWPLPAQRNETPLAEVYVGPSLLRNDALTSGGRELFGGWQASLNWNYSSVLGFKGDFGGHYRSIGGINFHQHEYLFGPQLSARSHRATGFLHALAGAATFGGGGSSMTGTAMAFGGGVDMHAGQHFAIRAVQVDYLPKRLAGDWFHDVRVSAGIVWRIGEK
ncbi:MAG: hypothetical protein LAN61_09025 [Acidobacteriia bacterium]|nr:hypothetical protein [Terriglobia bacterium]